MVDDFFSKADFIDKYITVIKLYSSRHHKTFANTVKLFKKYNIEDQLFQYYLRGNRQYISKEILLNQAEKIISK